MSDDPWALPQHRLRVVFGDSTDILHPGCEDYTFGRGENCKLTFGKPGPDGEWHFSRQAGSVRWIDPGFVLSNDSASKPFDVIVGGATQVLHPAGSPENRSTWRIGEPLTIRVYDRWREYFIDVVPDAPLPPLPPPPAGGEGATTWPRELRNLDSRARRILYVKYLWEEGGAIDSNARVCEILTSLGHPTDVDVVNRLVSRCRIYLKDRNVRGLDVPDVMGQQLLAWHVIQHGDRVLTVPRSEADAWEIRAAGPGDLDAVVRLLAPLSISDPRIAHVLTGRDDRNRAQQALTILVTDVAETMVGLGASWICDANGAAIWCPPPGPARPVANDLLARIAKVCAALGRTDPGPATKLQAACVALLGLGRRGPAPAYRLCALGVSTARRGRRVGDALLGAAVRRFDAEGAAAVVDTPAGPLERLCVAHGFEDIGGATDHYGDGLRRLWRDPRSAPVSSGSL